MDINKIIEKLETRKRVTEKYKEEIQKIFDYISSLNVDFDCSTNNNIICRYLFHDGNKWRIINSTEQNICWNMAIVIGIVNKTCGIFEKSYEGYGEEIYYNMIDLNVITYFNINQMTDGILSILKQLKNCSDRTENLEKILEITKAL